ncbi:hypothetical protein LR48_Vigan10g036800 [Vigna angularis]|uniref:Bifunctional inhibitor/plant lipid transfer protein/seed storage helical domain-containing protein n=2 Tax=Phaseolus angularis TaxID=3914 RepID=A0A0L9VHG5_PHAAN|nr:non-specific lipid transfer protein GPI-anchored 9 [Vigna angularis]KOM54476.1 hypothetical protein LR48_Vigan10g036800 [Vigna angularis]BAU02683.1 hypothetical protein VIGAN_11224500 [Vigna angularis var. angularis]
MKKMASNIGPLSFLFMVMFFSSYVHVGLSQTSLDQLLPGLGEGNFLQNAQCMQKLVPCQTYLKSQTDPPPETCCAPLKEMHDNKSPCLCNIVNKPSLLQSVGVSKDDLLKLPQACSIEADFSSCNDTGGSQGEDSVPDKDIAETSSTKTITPYGITSLGVTGFVALFTALVFSSY